MNLDEQAESFVEAFKGVYMRFHVRVAADVYRPSPESLAVLNHLQLSGPVLVSEASLHFDRSQAATSDIVTRLEARKLVKRKPDPRDRRRTLVWLTEAGIQVLKESEEVLSVSGITAALAALSDDERSQLVNGLQKLAKSAGGEMR